MAITPSFYISVNGGANQQGGIDVAGGDTIDLSPVSTTGWLRARWEIFDYPEAWSLPAGWSLDVNTGAYYYLGITPPQFTMPSPAAAFGKWMLRVMVNEQIDYGDTEILEGLYDESNALCLPSANGIRSIGARERAQFTTLATLVKSWARDIQRSLIAVDTAATIVTSGGLTMSEATTGTLNNVATTSSGQWASLLLFSGAGSVTLNGLASGAAGRILTIKKTGTGTLTIANEAGASTGINRLNTPNSANITLANGRSVVLIYNSTAQRWDAIGAISDFGAQDVTTTGVATAGSVVATTSVTAANVVASSYVSSGSSPATAGYYRAPTNGNDSTLVVRYLGVDYTMVGSSGGAYEFGNTAWVMRFKGNSAYLLAVTNPAYIYGENTLGSTYYSDRIGSSLPRHGESTPYASEGRISFGMSDTNQTVSAASYARKTNRISGALTAARTATYPHPSGESNSYDKFIENLCTGANLVISTGTGTTVTLVPGESQHLEFSPSGVRRPITPLADADPTVNGFRLTVLSGTALPTTDQANATTLYFAPYISGTIALYDGVGWKRYSSTQVSLALSGLSSNTNYDVFVNHTGSALALSLVAWAGATSRATSLATQNGVFVQSGDATKRYVGTIRMTSATQTQDTAAQRFIWNFYNRIDRHLYIEDTTASWTYNSATFRQVRATSTNRVETVSGDSIAFNAKVYTMQMGLPAGTGVSMFPGIGVDSTSTNSAKGVSMMPFVTTSPQWNPAMCELDTVLAAGYHAINWLESAHAGTCTAYGTLGAAQSHMRARAQF